MGSALVLLVVGLLLIFLEFYLPGGVVGSMGVIFWVLSIFIAGRSTESLVELLIFFVGSVVGLILVIRFAMKRIKEAPSGSSVYSEDDQEGYVGSSFDEGLVGLRGKTLTDLHPSGYVHVSGKKVQALARSGYIMKGVEVEVVSGEGSTLLVKEI